MIVLSKSFPQVIRTPNPRKIIGIPAETPLFAWVGDYKRSVKEVYESLHIIGGIYEEPTTLFTAKGIRAIAQAHENERWILACSLASNKYDEAALTILCFEKQNLVKKLYIPLEDSRYPGALSLCSSSKGFILCWEEWCEHQIRLNFACISHDFELSNGPKPNLTSQSLKVSRNPKLIGHGPDIFLTWLGSSTYRTSSDIYLKSLFTPAPTQVIHRSRGASIGGLEAACHGHGLWFAWHTNRRPGRKSDLTRWIELHFRSISGFHRRVSCSIPKRWGRFGEDQSMEFPLLFPLNEGNLLLGARSSHRLWLCEIAQQGKIIPLDQEGWECRSKGPALIELKDTGILIGYRKRQSLVIDRIMPSFFGKKPGVTPVEKFIRGKNSRNFHSPPFICRAPYKVFFGDLHQHTAHSDGTGSIKESYERARDFYGDDFTSVTDHESFLGKRIGNGEWAHFMAECDLYHEDGRFVTLPGYEWTGAIHPGPGHKCVYWPHTNFPLLGRDHPLTKNSADLSKEVQKRGGLIFPHHVGWTGSDWDAHDEQVQTCCEIVSCHGAYEEIGQTPIGQRGDPLEGYFLKNQLDRGLRFGFVGGSDGHGLLWHHGISRKRDSHRTGLTGVLVKELSRAEIFDALRKRRCFATSGARIILDLRVNKQPMGSLVSLQGFGPVKVDYFADGETSLLRADLILPRGRKIPLDFSGSHLCGSTMIDFEKDFNIKYLYLRVEQKDGEVAWSSPLWILS